MADTLQDFLVSLRYKSQGHREFIQETEKNEQAAKKFGMTVGKIGVAIVGMGVLAAKGTLRYAQSLEQLNFVAQRTGTSLAHLRALQLAGASLGSSAEGAQASIEGLAHFMRSNPGSSAFLQSLKVQTEDAKGNALDTVKVMENLADRFRKMPVYMAERYASMMGISENMMLAMRNPDFDAKIGQYANAEGKGIGKAGQSAHDLMNQDRMLEAHQFGLAAKTLTPAMNSMTGQLRNVNQSLENTNGWLSKMMAIWSAHSAIGSPVTKVAGAALGWWAFKKMLGVASGSGAASAASEGAAAAEGVAGAAGVGALATAGVGAGLMLYSPGLNKGESADLARRRNSLTGRQQYAVWTLMREGYTQAEAIGMAANFTRESEMNPMAVGDHGQAYGLGQWHKDRQAQYAKLFGHSMQSVKNPNEARSEQLAFAAWELKNRYAGVFKKMQAAGSDVRLQAEIVSRGYERPAATDAEAAKRATIAQNINTTINVQGSSNPEQTAHAVARAQKHVNQQMARNTAGAYR